MKRFTYFICVLSCILVLSSRGYSHTQNNMPVLHINWGTQVYGISADSVVITRGIVKPILMDANQ